MKRIYEEMMLREKAKEELLKEEDLRHLSKEEIDRLLDENDEGEE